VNTQEVTMRAATTTRTNRTLYPDIFVVVDDDSRGGCESCDLGLGGSAARVPVDVLKFVPCVGVVKVVISSVHYNLEARVRTEYHLLELSSHLLRSLSLSLSP